MAGIGVNIFRGYVGGLFKLERFISPKTIKLFLLALGMYVRHLFVGM